MGLTEPLLHCTLPVDLHPMEGYTGQHRWIQSLYNCDLMGRVPSKMLYSALKRIHHAIVKNNVTAAVTGNIDGQFKRERFDPNPRNGSDWE